MLLDLILVWHKVMDFDSLRDKMLVLENLDLV